MRNLTFEEVQEFLKKIGRGELHPELDGPDWDTQWFSTVSYHVSGWYLTIYLDCGEMDNLEYVKSPDGDVTYCDEFDTDPYDSLWSSDPDLYRQISKVLRIEGKGSLPMTPHEMDVMNLSATHDFVGGTEEHDFVDGSWIPKT